VEEQSRPPAKDKIWTGQAALEPNVKLRERKDGREANWAEREDDEDFDCLSAQVSDVLCGRELFVEDATAKPTRSVPSFDANKDRAYWKRARHA
jgi:hypothetical protein